MLKWLRSLFEQIFGQDTNTDIVLSDKMSSNIDLWARMYESGGPWCNSKSEIHSLRIPADIASEFGRLVTSEMKVTVSGSPRADFLQQALKPLTGDIRRYVENGCALGGEIFKPFISNGLLAIDIVQGDSFFPTTFDTSNRMTGAIFIAQLKRGGTIYTRAEHHELQGNVYTVENKAFASRSAISIGAQIDLSNVPEWSGIKPSVTIENVDRPLFAYFRIPQANKVDRHSPLGVSVFAEAVDTIRDADKQYGRYLWEYEGGQLAVDLDEELFKHNSDGSVEMPELEKRLYRRRHNESIDEKGGNFYEIFAPELRDESYRNGLNTILQRIEFQCGLAYGTLSNPQDTEKTATEINASKQRSYSTVHDIQLALQDALDDLIYAMDQMSTLYNLAPTGKYQTAYDWDDSIVNDPNQRKQMFWQYVQAGKFPFWRYLVEFENYTENDAKAIATEAVQSSNLSNPFGFGQGGGGDAGT